MKGRFSLAGILVVCLACDHKAADMRPRVERNLVRILHFEKGLYKNPDGAGFQPLAPFPPGKPWETPAAWKSKYGIDLEPATDGRFYEQYEVVVDPIGWPGATLGVLSRDGGRRILAQEKTPRWCLGLRDRSMEPRHSGPNRDTSIRRIGWVDIGEARYAQEFRAHAAPRPWGQ